LHCIVFDEFTKHNAFVSHYHTICIMNPNRSSSNQEASPLREERKIAVASSPTISSRTVRTTSETAEGDTDSLDLEGMGLQDIGFMLDQGIPSRLELLQWTTPETERLIRVALHVADDEPGAVQSGHYLWPAARSLADYLVAKEQDWAIRKQSADEEFSVTSVLELGAGCALASLTAQQVGRKGIQCIIVTDHDPGTLGRARDNHETTLERIMDSSLSDEALDKVINSVASIPVVFTEYEWGSPTVALVEELQEHTSPPSSTFDLILGSDLIYDIEVIEPLLSSAAQVMAPNNSRFWLSQSFSYGDAAEAEIDRVCQKLSLERTILEEGEPGYRIQQFRLYIDPIV
jgi:predicted nicotinamide N-methyase